MSAQPQPAFSQRSRAELIDRLRRETFDLAVIGGGITGAGIARDAALRGLKTALVEKQDFAGGTSSRSGRMIHGGLRYIEMLQFSIVAQAVAERATLSAMAPHLVTPLLITLPVYHKRSRDVKVWLGMWLYDALARFQNTHRHEHISTQQMAEREPALAGADLVGAFQYYDRAVDDARMTLATVRSTYAHGALALNYAEVQALLKSQGRVSGLAVRDRMSGEAFDIHAKVVVNATGAWNDAIRLLDGEEAPRTVRPNKGIHVIVPRARLRLCNAVDFAARGVKRTLYAIPWRTTVIVGTTDTDYGGDIDQ